MYFVQLVFANYLRDKQRLPAEELLTDHARLLRLTGPEMTVLRRRPARAGRKRREILRTAFSPSGETLTNDYFVNLLDASTLWTPAAGAEGVFEGRDRKTNAVKWTATRVDLIFGSHSQLRALAEVYAQRRREGEIRQGLRRGVDQGDERRPLRPRVNFRAGARAFHTKRSSLAKSCSVGLRSAL